MLKRILTPALIMGSLLAFSSSASAQEVLMDEVLFTGAITGSCSLDAVSNGTLAQDPLKTQLSTFLTGGSAGTATANCTAVQGDLVVFTPEKTVGPDDSTSTRYARINSPGLTTRDVSTTFTGTENAIPSSPMIIPNNGQDYPITVHMRSTRAAASGPLEDAEVYTYRVKLQLTHP